MFKSVDLSLIVEFMLMFYKDKPIDWLLDHIMWVKVCNPEKDAKHCDRQKANLRIRFKPSLFQHVGTHSSLAGKIQKLKDKDFGKQTLHKGHANPLAEVTTSLKTYQHFTLEKAYLGEDFFWAFTPVAGDFIRIRFFTPVRIERCVFRSGNEDHLHNTFSSFILTRKTLRHNTFSSFILTRKTLLHNTFSSCILNRKTLCHNTFSSFILIRKTLRHNTFSSFILNRKTPHHNTFSSFILTRKTPHHTPSPALTSPESNKPNADKGPIKSPYALLCK
eukprot:XP_013986476.1 PREDICTED: alpha-1,3-mannosyl-glycoprotein 4-beta-N-acetylglucosaminyltransferase B-like [Salmo salar]